MLKRLKKPKLQKGKLICGLAFWVSGPGLLTNAVCHEGLGRVMGSIIFLAIFTGCRELCRRWCGDIDEPDLVDSLSGKTKRCIFLLFLKKVDIERLMLYSWFATVVEIVKCIRPLLFVLHNFRAMHNPIAPSYQ